MKLLAIAKHQALAIFDIPVLGILKKKQYNDFQEIFNVLDY